MTATSLSHTFEDEKDLRRLSWCWAKAYDTKVKETQREPRDRFR
jgi:hypothetical protein